MSEFLANNYFFVRFELINENTNLSNSYCLIRNVNTKLFSTSLHEGQTRKILGEIEQAIKSGFKNIFLEAPAGFGKSSRNCIG